jgi:hypothetical protein
MKKYALAVIMLLISTNIFAVTQVREFYTTKEYREFVASNPNIKIINVVSFPLSSETNGKADENINNSTINSTTKHKNVLVVTMDIPQTN